MNVTFVDMQPCMDALVLQVNVLNAKSITGEWCSSLEDLWQ